VHENDNFFPQQIVVSLDRVAVLENCVALLLGSQKICLQLLDFQLVLADDFLDRCDFSDKTFDFFQVTLVLDDQLAAFVLLESHRVLVLVQLGCRFLQFAAAVMDADFQLVLERRQLHVFVSCRFQFVSHLGHLKISFLEPSQTRFSLSFQALH
jgi:hypothetical protein